MSLLLKGAWRRAVTSSHPFTNRTVSTNVPEVVKSGDGVMTSIKSCEDSGALLAAVQRHLPAMDHRHMLQALRALFDLHKTHRYKDTEKLIKDPTFTTLCQNFKKHARALEINDAIEATKVLTFLQVPPDSLIVQTMLQLIRSNINLLSLRQVMFLDFLLQKFDTKNHLIDALRLALPLVFQIHLPLELDRQDLPLLKDMLGYSCSRALPDRCINNIVTCLLLHERAMDVQVARSVLWSLCDVNCTEEVHPTRVQLLRLCMDVLARDLPQLPYEEVLRTVAKLRGRLTEKHHEYYDEALMDAVADYCVINELQFEKALLVARALSRIAHTNLNLVEYLCGAAAAQPGTLATARANILLGFISCLANSDYTPEPTVWSTLRGEIVSNPLLDGHNTALPWTKTCLELASLGVYEDRILKRVFSEDFLAEYLSRANNSLDYLQLLTLHEAVGAFHGAKYRLDEETLRHARSLYPLHQVTEHLREGVARGVGGDHHVAKNVVLPSGIVADVLLCLKCGEPIQLSPSTKERTPLEDLQLPEDGIVVCYLTFNQGCYSMNSSRLRGTFRLVVDILERQGYVAVPVRVPHWLGLPERERSPYLVRELRHRCRQLGAQLSAT